MTSQGLQLNLVNLQSPRPESGVANKEKIYSINVIISNFYTLQPNLSQKLEEVSTTKEKNIAL